jgi:citrate lyase subunit beta/citryl-CoA lyase
MRSLLFAPANHERRVRKLATCGADAVVLDLEDAVAQTEKGAARTGVIACLATLADATRCVRINAFPSGLAYLDLDAVVGADLDAIVLPKVESAEEVALVDSELERLERERGLRIGRVTVIALVETALGVLHADAIALQAPPRLRRLAFGPADYAAELGITPGPDGRELSWARSRLVAASYAGRLAPPLDGPFLDLQDANGLVADTRASRASGFRGRIVLHPNQLPGVHQGYSQAPPAELQRCRRIVEAFTDAEHHGDASLQVDGHFVDYPIYRQAREVLEQHEAHRTETRPT